MISDLLADAEHKMEMATDHVASEFSTVRTGRANPQLLQRISVEYYGQPTPLQQLASIAVPEARLLVIQPYDKTSVGDIERAIQQSDLGLNPSNDGSVIRIAFPPLTEERRRDLIKVVKHMAEEGRVSIRNIRRHSKTDMEAMHGDISDDDIRRGEEELQKLTDRFVVRVDQLLYPQGRRAPRGMTDRGDESKTRRVRRPWEEEPEEADVFTLPEPEQPAAGADVDLGDWEAMTEEGSSPIEKYTSEDYAAATTEEYRGLAEEVSRAAGEEWQQQAVAATLPGVDSGLVGFDDVSRASVGLEEDYEAHEQAASSDFAMRVGSAVVIFGMFLGSLLLGGWWFSGFVILVMVVACGEFYATVRHAGYRPLALFGLLGVVFMGAGAHTTGVMAIGGWAALFATASVLFFTLSPRRNPLQNASLTVAAMAWVGLLAFAVLIGQGPRPIEDILFVVLLVAFNDMGAYFVGRSFGRRKLAPRLSPSKTVEGFFGGLIAALVVSSILVSFPAWEVIGLARGLVIAAVVGVVAPIGDAAESMVKRALGVKDMGSVLPGHGGILDRIDGFLFAVPTVYFLFRGFGLL